MKQHYAARSLLALDSGTSPEVVAERLGLPLAWIETWSRQYQRAGTDYIVALGHIGLYRRRRAKQPVVITESEKAGLAEQRRLIQEISPRIVDLLKLARTPSAEGADFEANPASLFLAE